MIVKRGDFLVDDGQHVAMPALLGSAIECVVVGNDNPLQPCLLRRIGDRFDRAAAVRVVGVDVERTGTHMHGGASVTSWVACTAQRMPWGRECSLVDEWNELLDALHVGRVVGKHAP